MTVIQSSNDDLRQYVYNKQYVIVKFDTVQHCPVCKQLQPVFERVSEEYKNITFVTMNAEDNPVAKKLIISEKSPLLVFTKKVFWLNADS